MKHEKLRILIPTIAEVPNYLNALTALGAAPEALDQPADPSGYDGLLLPGGGDIDPQRYGQEVNGSRWVKPELDALQFAVLDAFVKAKRPVFGICRGHQLLNVYFGGSLIQDIESPIQHSPSPGVWTAPTPSGRRREAGFLPCTAGISPPTAPITRVWIGWATALRPSPLRRTGSWRPASTVPFPSGAFSIIRSGCVSPTGGRIPWTAARSLPFSWTAAGSKGTNKNAGGAQAPPLLLCNY